MRVVIADDHAPTRGWVRQALEAGGCVVVGEAADGAGAVDRVREAVAAGGLDVALLDVRMPGGGVLAAFEVTQAHPDVAVVMLTSSRGDEDLFGALRAGASGYLLKDMDPARLPDALAGVVRGEGAMPSWLVRRVMEQFRTQPPRRLSRWSRPGTAKLTEREAEVLDLMVEGRSTDQIAAAMFVAPVTVRTHVRAILKKLRVPDREAAVRLVRGD
ncbi:response regulator transcription factor [Phycicoccus sp. CMS6Z-2]|nr:response regulator transcription factor [Phycicoccus flavus]